MVKIIKGEDKKIKVRFTKEDGRPFDLTGATNITFFFAGVSAVQSVSLTASEVSILNAVLGEVEATVNDTKTDALKAGEQQTFEADIEFGTTKHKVQFVEQLNVVESIG
jgi:hypothetical protein